MGLTEGSNPSRDGVGRGFLNGFKSPPEGRRRGEGVEGGGEVKELVVGDLELAACDGPSLIEDNAVDLRGVLERFA